MQIIWPNRDPLEDEFEEGPNLYSFVANDPEDWMDSDGRARISCPDITTLIDQNGDSCGGVDEPLLKCLFKRESDFDPNASNGSQTGLGQIGPPAAKDVGCDGKNLTNPAMNVKCSSKYLCLLVKRSKGDIGAALRKYSHDKSGRYGNAVKDCADCLRKKGKGSCDDDCLKKAKNNPTP